AASVLILPQSILLGMTFPLMSAGIIRRFPNTPGGSIAMLYFTNSIGAAIGVLVSGFLMIRMFGLPGTIMTAGFLNILLALTVWILVRLDPEPETEPLPLPNQAKSGGALTTLFLMAAFITGAASFIYEISWIRMLSLVLGATTHSFEIMLSAFVTGLAFGGLWIKRRIDQIEDPVRFSGYVQLIMGSLALLTIPIYILTFDWIVLLRTALGTNDTAFAGYTIASHAIALAVMLPTTFMAGMTLPLFTFVLLRKGSGEASIGHIYAANTIGAIVGVLFAVHVGLPAFGLKNLIVFGAMLDIVLGFFLLFRSANMRWSNVRFATTTGAALIICGIVVLGADFDERLLDSGVYRNKTVDIAKDDRWLFYRDGKTASVSFRVDPDGIGILSTNGKVDASIQLDQDKPASTDELTMILAAAIPMAYAPNAKTVANIGLGSGQTAHVLLGNPDIDTVDTIEIEVEMVNASRNFAQTVWRTYEDPRSKVHIEDAKTFFALNQSIYDIIIAEPSNPWVSGVSSLFSQEFYSTVTDYLSDDGIFVQWIQAYEFTDELAISILKALSGSFADYSIYISNASDIILIAKKDGQLGEPNWNSILQGEIGESLARVGINNAADLLVRQTASRAVLIPYLEDSGIQANSDYFPYVDLNAGKAMFAGSNANMFSAWVLASTPVLEMLTRSQLNYEDVSPRQVPHRAQLVDATNWVFEKITESKISDPPAINAHVPFQTTYSADWLVASQLACIGTSNSDRWAESAFEVMSFTLSNLNPDRAEMLINEIVESGCELVDDPAATAWINLYRAVARRDGKAMYRTARLMLDSSPEEDNTRLAYAISAAMLGAVSVGRHRDAYDVWTEYGVDFYNGRTLPAHMKLIVSLSARFEDGPRLSNATH
ncbi:MAG: hypothetical protein OER97_04695, partial [Gammaproteobacteria bacterium]|nr:hypothetical protein [Gammaproteobacteria bacterium]